MMGSSTGNGNSNRLMENNNNKPGRGGGGRNNIEAAGADYNNPRAILRCPRCDSSNTKFCYYNNYSLSQPRHFCKACKRYWTRGGTLRNVPVGGGCRRNKRINKQIKPNSSSSSSTQIINQQHHEIGLISKAVSNQHVISRNSLFYNLPVNNQLSSHNDINNLTARSSFLSRQTLVPNSSSSSCGYDILPPQFNSLGLGFSSTTDLICGGGGGGDPNIDYRNGFNPITSSNSLLSNFSLLGTTSTTLPTTTSTTATTTSLIASSLENQKLNWGVLNESTRPTSTDNNNNNNNHFQDLSSSSKSDFETGLQMVGNNNIDPRMMDMVNNVKGGGLFKIEEATGINKNKVNWNSPFENSSMELNNNIINGSSHNNNSSSIYWNHSTMNVGGGTTANWSDLSNFGSSITPLI